MIENKPWIAAIIGTIRSPDGRINWLAIVASIMSAAIIGLGSSIIEQGKLLAQLDVQRKIDGNRIVSLENGTNLATSERYRASDASRDFERVDRQYKLYTDRMEQKIIELELRIRELERRR